MTTTGALAPSVSMLRILVVEDQEDDVILIRRALTGFGLSPQLLRVDTAPAVQAALTAQDWDIVLCDCAMPALDLPAVLALMRLLAPSLPLVVVSGTVGEEAVVEMMRLDVADLVLKDRLMVRLGPVVEREVTRARSLLAAETQRRRIADVLHAFAEAQHWHDALAASLRDLGRSFHADLTAMAEIDRADGMLRPIAHWSQGCFDEVANRMHAASLPAAATALGRAVLRGEALIVPAICDLPGTGSGVLALLAKGGLTSLVCQPVAAGGRQFCLVVAFSGARPDLADLAADMAAISATLQPVLLRKISETEHALLGNALEAALSGVLITEVTLQSPGQRIVYANDAACRMSGHARHELLGRSPRLLQGPGTDPAVCQRMRDAVAKAEPIDVELLNYRRDGTTYLVALNITPVQDQGRVTHFIAIQTDITARRAAEREAQDREASFRLLFDNNPMPMWVYELTTLKFLEVNAAAVERYGWSHEAFLTMTVADIRPADQRAAFRWELTTSALPPRTTATTHVTSTGEQISVRVAAHRIDYQGRPARLAVIWDVTEIERSRDALRRKNVELARLTDTLGARTVELVDASRLARIGTWSMEFAFRLVFWSPETSVMLGRDQNAGPLDARQVLGYVHPDDRDLFTYGYRRLMRMGIDHQTEYRILRPSGEMRVLRELARPRFDAERRLVGMSGVIQDITEHKLAEEALLRSEKLKTLGQIAGGISHDFNNLLTIIGLNLETALFGDDVPADLRSLLEPALRATERGAELTGQMLAYARRPSLRPMPADLRDLVLALRRLLERALGDRGELLLVLPGEAVPVRLDPGQFENALLNLVINARDAMPDGGTITIAVSAETLLHAVQGQPDAFPAGAYGRVSVRDTGQGIPADVLPRIIEPFFTTKPVGKGSGMGLSMVYAFVHQSSGVFSVVSVPGEGTVIALYFPLNGDGAAAPAESHAPAPSAVPVFPL